MFVPCFAKSILSDGTRIKFFSLAISFLLCIPGCGESGPRMVPVSGTVSLKGKPTEGVEVYFVHENLVTMGTTDNQGHYDLIKGATVGENKVYFSKIEGATKSEEDDGMSAVVMSQAEGPGGAKRKKQLIPAEYSNASEPKLNFEVPSGGSKSADFEL